VGRSGAPDVEYRVGQPRSQSFSLEGGWGEGGWTFKGKALGTGLRVGVTNSLAIILVTSCYGK